MVFCEIICKQFLRLLEKVIAFASNRLNTNLFSQVEIHSIVQDRIRTPMLGSEKNEASVSGSVGERMLSKMPAQAVNKFTTCNARIII